MALKNDFYLFVVVLIILCILDLCKIIVLDDRIKISILVIILVTYAINRENFDIYKSANTNEIIGNTGIFYENPSDKSFKNLKYKGPMKDRPMYNGEKSLGMFFKNKCKPECCPSQYSCDRGCICMDNEQKMRLYKHR